MSVLVGNPGLNSGIPGVYFSGARMLLASMCEVTRVSGVERVDPALGMDERPVSAPGQGEDPPERLSIAQVCPRIYPGRPQNIRETYMGCLG